MPYPFLKVHKYAGYWSKITTLKAQVLPSNFLRSGIFGAADPFRVKNHGQKSPTRSDHASAAISANPSRLKRLQRLLASPLLSLNASWHLRHEKPLRSARCRLIMFSVKYAQWCLCRSTVIFVAQMPRSSSDARASPTSVLSPTGGC